MSHYLNKILIAVLALGFVFAILANIFAWKFLILPLSIIVALVFLTLAYMRLDYALYVFIAELVLGGAGGRWLDFRGLISIRIVFFAILFLIWFFYIYKKRISLKPLLESKFTKPIIILSLFFPIFWGLLGWIYGFPPNYILKDANGFLFYTIFFLLITVLPKYSQGLKLVKVYLASIIAASFVLTVLYFLSALDLVNIWFLKQLFLGRMFYGGKIGIMPDGAYRLFTGNGVFIQIGLLLLASFILLRNHLNKNIRNLILISILFVYLAIVASYTRGFWVGIIGALVFLVLWLNWKQRAKLIVGAIILFLISEIVFWGLFHLSFFNFFFNRLATSVSIEKDPVSVGERVSQVRVLGGAILRHPFWGTGFGTYFPIYRTEAEVADPYSFELGYLDMVVKFGIIGFAFWGLVILGIFFKGLKLLWFKYDLSYKKKAVILGFLSGLIALLIVGGTSPFLMSAFGIAHIVLTIYILEVISQSIMKNVKIKNQNDSLKC